jgi:hypothetical protein
MEPYTEAVQGFLKYQTFLANDVDLSIITSPMYDYAVLFKDPESSERCFISERARNLNQHFGIQKSQFIWTSEKYKVPLDFLIEDSREQLDKWMDRWYPRVAVGGILIDRPWNQGYERRGVVRKKSVLEAFKYLDDAYGGVHEVPAADSNPALSYRP